MDIDKELEELFNDPLLDISEKETSLFDICLLYTSPSPRD